MANTGLLEAKGWELQRGPWDVPSWVGLAVQPADKGGNKASCVWAVRLNPELAVSVCNL